MYSSRKVDRIGILCAVFLNDYVRGNQLSKVVHDELCKDFLEDVLYLFCVKLNETKGIFELTERSLNTPAFGVQLLQRFRWESLGGKIGNNGFKRRFRKPETNNTEGNLVNCKWIMLMVGTREIIKGHVRRKPSVLIGICRT